MNGISIFPEDIKAHIINSDMRTNADSIYLLSMLALDRVSSSKCMDAD